MFIPNTSLVGKTVILTRDVSSLQGTFCKGSELRCVSEGPRGYDFEDADGNRVTETGWKQDFYVVKN